MSSHCFFFCNWQHQPIWVDNGTTGGVIFLPPDPGYCFLPSRLFHSFVAPSFILNIYDTWLDSKQSGRQPAEKPGRQQPGRTTNFRLIIHSSSTGAMNGLSKLFSTCTVTACIVLAFLSLQVSGMFEHKFVPETILCYIASKLLCDHRPGCTNTMAEQRRQPRIVGERSPRWHLRVWCRDGANEHGWSDTGRAERPRHPEETQHLPAGRASRGRLLPDLYQFDTRGHARNFFPVHRTRIKCHAINDTAESCRRCLHGDDQWQPESDPAVRDDLPGDCE